MNENSQFPALLAGTAGLFYFFCTAPPCFQLTKEMNENCLLPLNHFKYAITRREEAMLNFLSMGKIPLCLPPDTFLGLLSSIPSSLKENVSFFYAMKLYKKRTFSPSYFPISPFLDGNHILQLSRCEGYSATGHIWFPDEIRRRPSWSVRWVTWRL